eukprot:1829639-Amphidinium_carterae.1
MQQAVKVLTVLVEVLYEYNAHCACACLSSTLTKCGLSRLTLTMEYKGREVTKRRHHKETRNTSLAMAIAK